MRRGSLNKISIILIITAGIFTLISFGLDQMVVQTEDKFRKKDLEYKQVLFDFNNYKSINENIHYIDQIVTSKFTSLHFQNEINKEILTYLVEDEFANKFYQGLDGASPDELKKFTEDLRKIHKRNYLSLYRNYIIEIKSMKEILKYIFFSDSNLQKKYEEIIKIVDIDFEKHIKNFKLNEHNKNGLDLDSYKKINKVYFNLLSFNDVFISVGDLLDNLKTETGKKWEGKGRKIESIQEELTLIQSLENKYILFSILCQILGLVTLLILFRVLLKDN